MRSLKTEKQKSQMSFWGIGPVFVLCCIIIWGTATCFSLSFPEIFRFSSGKFLVWGISMILLFFGLYLWIVEGWKIDEYIRNGILATKGGYGIVRNPVYSGILFTLTGISLILQSWLMLMVMPLNYFILRYLLIKEDIVLKNAFGDKYLNYKKRVNPVIPKIKSFYTAFFYPVETGKIAENLFAVKNRNVNFFVYQTMNQILFFDTGYGDIKMMDVLKKLDLPVQNISTVFLTHTDPDHANGLPFFKDAAIYFGKDEEALINGKKIRFSFLIRNKHISGDYHLLEDNQVITIDNTQIRTVFTPGHTPGHVAYLIDNKILISGDSVTLQNDLIKPFYRIFNMNQKQAKKSADIISKMKGKYTICSAHTGIMKIKS